MICCGFFWCPLLLRLIGVEFPVRTSGLTAERSFPAHMITDVSLPPHGVFAPHTDPRPAMAPFSKVIIAGRLRLVQNLFNL